MAVKTYNETNVSWQKVIAVILQIGSYFTTLWFVQWIWPEGVITWQSAIALIGEIMLMVLKEQMFRGSDQTAGWVGMTIDSVINCGGLLPKACLVLTFPPLAAIMRVIGTDPKACTQFAPEAVIIAAVFGIVLSVLPHRLWHN